VRHCLAVLLGATAVAQAQTQLVIVSGIGGDPKYTQAFGQLSTALAQAANERAGLGDSAIVWFGEAGAPRSRWYRGPSTRDNVERTLARLAARKEIDEQVVVVLIGHGSGEGADTRISLPGADLTAADFAKLLAPFGNRRVAFVNLTSASGDMLPVLSGPSRVVMTATKSAFERNESQFARFFVDALARDGADSDKDGRVSLLEAFRYAESETKRFYETDGKLATEHAQLADEGQLAQRFFLTAGAAGAPSRASGNARLAALYAERFALDEQIQALKKRKAGMTSDAYDAELEKLLLALALKAREIRQVERGT
jgi:2-hydroxychromene-2-carboxylate isomerase